MPTLSSASGGRALWPRPAASPHWPPFPPPPSLPLVPPKQQEPHALRAPTAAALGSSGGGEGLLRLEGSVALPPDHYHLLLAAAPPGIDAATAGAVVGAVVASMHARVLREAEVALAQLGLHVEFERPASLAPAAAAAAGVGAGAEAESTAARSSVLVLGSRGSEAGGWAGAQQKRRHPLQLAPPPPPPPPPPPLPPELPPQTMAQAQALPQMQALPQTQAQMQAPPQAQAQVQAPLQAQVQAPQRIVLVQGFSPQAVGCDELFGLFSRLLAPPARVLRIKLLAKKPDTALVELESEQSAEQAAERLHGALLESRALRCERSPMTHLVLGRGGRGGGNGATGAQQWKEFGAF